MMNGDIPAVRQVNGEWAKWVRLPNLSQLLNGQVISTVVADVAEVQEISLGLRHSQSLLNISQPSVAMRLKSSRSERYSC